LNVTIPFSLALISGGERLYADATVAVAEINATDSCRLGRVLMESILESTG
jgi:hypothetical protein